MTTTETELPWHCTFCQERAARNVYPVTTITARGMLVRFCSIFDSNGNLIPDPFDLEEEDLPDD